MCKMKVVCASPSCKYAAEKEDSSDVIFISFPNDETAKIWAHNCGRLDLLMKSEEELHLNYYICSHHIEDQYFISKTNPIMIAQGAVPTLFRTQSLNSAAKKSSNLENKLHYQRKNCKNLNENVHNANTSDEYHEDHIENDLQNNFTNSEFQREKRDSINVPEQKDETDALTYCVINAEIDQYNGMTIRFSTLCRICGDVTPDGVEIFGEKGVEVGLREKIKLHMPIVVDMDDVMPQRLCVDCYNKLEIAHSLVTTCLQTDIGFRRFLNIEEIPEYDSRFEMLLEQCSMEIAEDIGENESIRQETVSLNSDKEDELGTSIATENDTIQDPLNIESTSLSFTSESAVSVESSNSNARSLRLTSSKKNPVNSDLNDLLQVLKSEENHSNNLPILADEKAAEDSDPQSNVDTITDADDNGGIVCAVCKDTFKTQEIFEDHKILCYDDDNILDLNDSKAVRSTESVNFHCSMKTCSNCEEVFETDALFEQHRDSCLKPTTQLSCQSCSMVVSNAEDLESHEQLHLQMGTMPIANRKCGYCLTAFCTRKELQNHIAESHGGQTLFKCSMCDKAYEKWSSLDVHEATHRSDKPFLCDLCGKSFKHANNLRGHKRIHLDDSKKKRHVCEVCGNAFRSRFHLSEHMNHHNGNKPYACEQCGKTFYKRIQLRQHRQSHGLNKYACPICGVTFNRRGNMNTHVKRHNNGEEGVYKCSICGHKVSSMSELKLHRKQHSDDDIMESVKKKSVDKRVWQCGVCTRVFSKRAVWSNHERSHAGDKVSVECDECGKKLSSKSSLAYHTKAMHSMNRPHMCQFCGASFVSKESRLIHERIHTGERPYVCQICKMQYRCSSNLSQHMKSHSGSRPYVCQYCNKGFTRRGALHVHERIHTGEKPFACVVCARTFSQKNDMLKHTKTHHIKSIQCEQCDEIFSTKREILKHIVLHEQNTSSPNVIQGYVELPQQLESYTINIPYSSIEESGDLHIVQND